MKNLKEYADPYLERMFKIAIESQTTYTEQFLKGTAEVFTAPTLLTLAKNSWKSVQNHTNFTKFLNYIADVVSFDSIWKTAQNFFSRSLNTLV